MANRKIEYIFCINTGRSGSHYLSKIFNAVEDCVSVHEPSPKMNGKLMQKFLHGDVDALRKKIDKKLAFIKKLKGRSKLYVETNHCFIKGFGWLIPKYIPQEKLAVVTLTRKKEKIIDSTFKINCTCLTNYGHDWIMLPTKKDPLVPVPGTFPQIKYYAYRVLVKTFLNWRIAKLLSSGKRKRVSFIKNYEKEMLKWYIEETKAMEKKYKKTFPNIQYAKADIEDLNNMSGVETLFNELNLDQDIDKSLLKKTVGKRTNKKLAKKTNNS